MTETNSADTMSAAISATMAASPVEEASKDDRGLSLATRSNCSQPDYNSAAALGRFPRASSTIEGTKPACPWCRSDMIEATVTIGSLNAAWQDFETDWPTREVSGEPGGELICHCPTCRRPSMLALGERTIASGCDRRQRRYIRLVPVRTEADALYLGLVG